MTYYLHSLNLLNEFILINIVFIYLCYFVYCIFTDVSFSNCT